jgi:hypothetical protein
MDVLAALHTLAEGKYQRSIEINFLIEKTYSLATCYLGLNHKKIFKLLENGEYTIDEIAVDAIASLFIYDDAKRTTPLANSFINWTPKIKNKSEALFFLNKIVAARTEQHIFTLLREYDPFFSKIFDSINYLIKTGGYKKNCIAGKTCILENDMVNIEGDIIDYEDFKKIPIALLIDKKKLLATLFSYLRKETNFILAIPINQLVYRIKHINFADFISGYNSSIPAKKFELTEITDFGFESAKNKLEISYLQKEKLNIYEASCIRDALRDMANDLLDGGINPGMYEYLSVYMKELDKKIYVAKYHNILEYLVKVMKNTIAEKISQEN